MKKASIVTLGLLMPMFAFAQSSQTTLQDVLGSLGEVLNAALPVVVALALLYFFWGLAQFILAAGEEEKRKEGRQIMLWGVIALFIIVSVWGLVRVVQQTLDIDPEDTIDVPTVNIQ